MAEFLKRTWAEVNLNNIRHNILQVKNRLKPSCMLLGVIKADAYGHGDRFVAREMVRAGVNWFGVSNLHEAIALRKQDIFLPILIFGVTPPEHVSQLCQYHITQTVFSYEYACALEEAAKEANLTVNAHLKIDTGMTRIGFGADEESVQRLEQVYQMEHIHVTGIFTHFSCADEFAPQSVAYTQMQFATFMETVSRLEQKGMEFPIKHCCNSAGVMNYPQMHLDMVRPGIILYGLTPSEECRGLMDLRPAMEVKSAVSMVKEIPAGTQISYGRTFTAPKDMKIATVPIGYADGYRRGLSNKGRMLVNGQYAPVIGRVCMDQLMLDVTHIANVERDTIVTVIGCDGDKAITMEELGELNDTCNYEITCIQGKRVPRIYLMDGEKVGMVDYILQDI